MYDGPIIDSFLHGPWLGDFSGEAVRADVVPWTDDRRLARVMKTFHHPTGEGEEAPQIGLERLLSELDTSGVTGGVVAAKVYYPSTLDRLEALHTELARLAAQSSSKLKWIATILPPPHGAGSYWDLMEGPRILDMLKDAPGLIGVHITPSPWGLAPNDRWYYPLYARCVDLGLTLYSYVGMPGPLWPMGPNNPAHLEDVALAFPDLQIVAHHIGDPWNDVMVRLAARHPNIWICTSAWHPRAYPPAIKEFLAGRWHGTRGCDKVIFASDYPLLDLKKTTDAARAMNLADEHLQRILHDNAHELLFEGRR